MAKEKERNKVLRRSMGGRENERIVTILSWTRYFRSRWRVLSIRWIIIMINNNNEVLIKRGHLVLPELGALYRRKKKKKKG